MTDATNTTNPPSALTSVTDIFKDKFSVLTLMGNLFSEVDQADNTADGVIDIVGLVQKAGEFLSQFGITLFDCKSRDAAKMFMDKELQRLNIKDKFYDIVGEDGMVSQGEYIHAGSLLGHALINDPRVSALGFDPASTSNYSASASAFAASHNETDASVIDGLSKLEAIGSFGFNHVLESTTSRLSSQFGTAASGIVPVLDIIPEAPAPAAPAEENPFLSFASPMLSMGMAA